MPSGQRGGGGAHFLVGVVHGLSDVRLGAVGHHDIVGCFRCLMSGGRSRSTATCGTVIISSSNGSVKVKVPGLLLALVTDGRR